MNIFESLQNDRLAQLRANPAETLKQAGLSVPSGMSDPRQIVQHLLSSGQITNPRLQMALRLLGR